MRISARSLVVQCLALFLLAGCASAEDDAEDNAKETADDEAALAGATPPETIAYASPADGARVLDLYRPSAPATARQPLVVWIHGGAFAYGTRRDPHLVRLAQHSAALGFVSVSIDYTLTNAGFDEAHPFPYPGSAVRAASTDARAAIAFLRAHAPSFGIDPDRIAIGGASAGSITALDVAYGGTRDPGIRAVVDLWGALEGHTIAPGAAPLLVIHGTADQHWMPFAQAERLRDGARAANVPCTFLPLPGKNHGPWDGLDDYLAAIGPFLKRSFAR